MSASYSDIRSKLEEIGTEATGIRLLELSFVAQRSASPMASSEQAEWEQLILERREHLGRKIDEFFAVTGIKPNETLDSLRADRARRARK